MFTADIFVNISRQALQLLRKLHEITGTREYLFPKIFRKTPDSEPYMHQGTLTRALQYMGIKLVSHGFRGTASTLLNEMSYNPDWIEAQLAQSKQDAVRASYNHAQWLSQRREMMQQWADFIDGLNTDPIAVPINQSA